MTLEEIRSLDAGSWKSTAFRGEKIPLLQEVLDEMPVNVWLNVHLKEAGLTAKLVTEMLARNDRLHQAFIAAGADAAEMARSIAPEVMICNMDRMDSPVNYLKKTFEMKADFIQLNGKIVPAFRDYAIELKSKGVRINYFGTDKPDEIIRLFDDGIDFPLVNDIISTIQVAVESGIEPVTPVFRTKK
jgi:glycerophosphoryl diester phosphodiesterase